MFVKGTKYRAHWEALERQTAAAHCHLLLTTSCPLKDQTGHQRILHPPSPPYPASASLSERRSPPNKGGQKHIHQHFPPPFSARGPRLCFFFSGRQSRSDCEVLQRHTPQATCAGVGQITFSYQLVVLSLCHITWDYILLWWVIWRRWAGATLPVPVAQAHQSPGVSHGDTHKISSIPGRT